jgi:hypothetical protein
MPFNAALLETKVAVKVRFDKIWKVLKGFKVVVPASLQL